jgi:hypothetical protein
MAVLMFSTVVHCTVHMNPGPSSQRILTNESASRITCMNRVVQSQLLQFIGADKRQKTKDKRQKTKDRKTQRVTYGGSTLPKNPLAPMGVLTPASAHARPYTRPPIDTRGNFSAHMSAESPSNISSNLSEVISEVSEP